jgi:lipoic acid synthetase
MRRLGCIDLGRIAYEPALRIQKDLLQIVQRPKGEQEYLILAEHDPPVITLGIGADTANILATEQQLIAAGIEVHKTRRGGDVTYHGPGQLVGYPILRIDEHGRDVRSYIRDLSGAIICVLGGFGITATRKEGFPGVWVGQKKIASIGIAVSKWVSYHGFALNVCPNMDHFALIVPCGLSDVTATSMADLLDRTVDLEEIKPLLLEQMVGVFGFSGWSEVSPDGLV